MVVVGNVQIYNKQTWLLKWTQPVNYVTRVESPWIAGSEKILCLTDELDTATSAILWEGAISKDQYNSMKGSKQYFLKPQENIKISIIIASESIKSGIKVWND